MQIQRVSLVSFPSFFFHGTLFHARSFSRYTRTFDRVYYSLSAHSGSLRKTNRPNYARAPGERRVGRRVAETLESRIGPRNPPPRSVARTLPPSAPRKRMHSDANGFQRRRREVLFVARYPINVRPRSRSSFARVVVEPVRTWGSSYLFTHGCSRLATFLTPDWSASLNKSQPASQSETRPRFHSRLAIHSFSELLIFPEDTEMREERLPALPHAFCSSTRDPGILLENLAILPVKRLKNSSWILKARPIVGRFRLC